MTGREHGQPIGIGHPPNVEAVPVARALGTHGTVPLGQDGEQRLCMSSWYRASDHMTTYFVHSFVHKISIESVF